jgi:hypothetical protein
MRTRRSTTYKSSFIGMTLAAGSVVLASLSCGGGGGGGGGHGGSNASGGAGGDVPVPSPKAACAHYIDCLKEVDLSAATAELGTYGDSGSCWGLSAGEQDICGAYCNEQVAEQHNMALDVVACAQCAADEGCLDPEKPRCFRAGQANALCEQCATDAHCTAGNTCQHGQCWPPECADTALAKQLHDFTCSAVCDPVFCDAEFDGFEELYARELGCHAEYVALVNCQLSSGDQGCSPLYACKALYDAEKACINFAQGNGIRVCAGPS